MNKYCKWCSQTKPTEKFGFSPYTRVDGIRRRGNKCKVCIYACGRRWSVANRGRDKELHHLSYLRNYKAYNTRHLDNTRRRRVAKYNNGEVDIGITMEKIYIRDEFMCGICGNFCSLDHASLDHIIPVSKGGTHTWDNVQLAHGSCNVQKGNR